MLRQEFPSSQDTPETAAAYARFVAALFELSHPTAVRPLRAPSHLAHLGNESADGFATPVISGTRL